MTHQVHHSFDAHPVKHPYLGQPCESIRLVPQLMAMVSHCAICMLAGKISFPGKDGRAVLGSSEGYFINGRQTGTGLQ